MSAAIIAASITNVPEPHMGSRNSAPVGGELRPAGTQQNARGQVLLERRLTCLAPIAASVQALPGKIE